MPIAVAVAKYSPAVNPDRVILKLTFTGNYTQTAGDTLNLNPASWSDPNGVGVIGNPLNPPSINPQVISNNFNGTDASDVAFVVPSTSLATYKLRIFAIGGTELSTAAYPADILAGNMFIEMFI